jgi:hypothetical protein
MKALITLAAVLSAVFAAAPAALADAFITTDTLGGNGHPKSTLQHYRFITDTLAPGGGTVVSAPVAGGFNWADAGIGAAGTAGLVLLLLGIARVRQQHRRRLLAA